MKSILALLLGTAGCSTIHDLAREARIYGGVRTNPMDVCEAAGYDVRGLSGVRYIPMLICFRMADLPLSLVMDTLFLPFTVPLSLFRAGEAATPPSTDR